MYWQAGICSEADWLGADTHAPEPLDSTMHALTRTSRVEHDFREGQAVHRTLATSMSIGIVEPSGASHDLAMDNTLTQRSDRSSVVSPKATVAKSSHAQSSMSQSKIVPASSTVPTSRIDRTYRIPHRSPPPTVRASSHATSSSSSDGSFMQPQPRFGLKLQHMHSAKSESPRDDLHRSSSRPPKPSSSGSRASRSSRSISSQLTRSSGSSIRQQRLQYELEAAEEIAQLEEQLENDRIARRKQLIEMKLALKHAQLDEKASCTSKKTSSAQYAAEEQRLGSDSDSSFSTASRSDHKGVVSSKVSEQAHKSVRAVSIHAQSDPIVVLASCSHEESGKVRASHANVSAKHVSHLAADAVPSQSQEQHDVRSVNKALQEQLLQERQESLVREKAFQLRLHEAQQQIDMLQSDRSTSRTSSQSRKSVVSQSVQSHTSDVEPSAADVSGAHSHSGGDSSLKKFVARQSVVKDLPEYTGTAEEWPVFKHLFESSTKDCSFTDAENLHRLHRALKGKAKEAVQGMMTVPGNVANIMRTLEMRFGRADLVVQALITKVKSMRNIRYDDSEGLVEFSTAVQNLVSTMQLLNATGHMMNPQLIADVVGKLPGSLRLQWGEQVVQDQAQGSTSLTSFSTWLARRAEAACVVATPKSQPIVTQGGKPIKTTTHSTLTTVASSPTGKSKEASSTPVKCLFCSAERHRLVDCPKFLKESVEERRKWVRENKLCFNCLRRNHQARDCKKSPKCKQCTGKHQDFLHEVRETTVETVSVHAEPILTPRVLLRVVPVILHGQTGSFETNALLDEGSTVSLIDSGLADQLGITATSSALPLRMRWTNGHVHEESASCMINIEVSPVDQSDKHVLRNVRTIPNLDLPVQSINPQRVAQQWQHLQSMPIPSTVQGQPKLLLGQDNIHLIMPREIIEGPSNSPVVTRCTLGWSLHGQLGIERSRVDENVFVMCAESRDQELHEMVKRSFSLESVGVVSKSSNQYSKEDAHAAQIMESTTHRVGERFETGLLWKALPPRLPHSRTLALDRLRGLRRKMDKQPDLGPAYQAKIDEYVQKGYARELTAEEAAVEPPNTWYLPHFAVFNPNKPGKLRMVFDAAAKSSGVSLNSQLLPGPDLLNPLVSVLFQFRQRKVGFGGDIREMFHQVRIIEQDRYAQRFLWFGAGDSDKPAVYVMDAMIFGAVCSPASAQFVMRKNAEEFETEFPEATRAIKERHYMDDYFDSADDEELASKQIADVITVHQRGGFEIRNWISNSKQVLQHLAPSLRARGNVDFSSESDMPVERALGMRWDPNCDFFIFSLSDQRWQRLQETAFFTKRAILSNVMSIFDPLGLVAPITIVPRVLLQDVWRSGIGWDDELPSSLHFHKSTYHHTLYAESVAQKTRHLHFLPSSTAVCQYKLSNNKQEVSSPNEANVRRAATLAQHNLHHIQPVVSRTYRDSSHVHDNVHLPENTHLHNICDV